MSRSDPRTGSPRWTRARSRSAACSWSGSASGTSPFPPTRRGSMRRTECPATSLWSTSKRASRSGRFRWDAARGAWRWRHERTPRQGRQPCLRRAPCAAGGELRPRRRAVRRSDGPQRRREDDAHLPDQRPLSGAPRLDRGVRRRRGGLPCRRPFQDGPRLPAHDPRPRPQRRREPQIFRRAPRHAGRGVPGARRGGTRASRRRPQDPAEGAGPLGRRATAGRARAGSPAAAAAHPPRRADGRPRPAGPPGAGGARPRPLPRAGRQRPLGDPSPRRDRAGRLDRQSRGAPGRGGHGMNARHAARAFGAIVRREALRFTTQRGRLVASIVRPLVWLAIFAVGFRAVLGLAITPPYQTYILYETYVVPGLAGMMLLFHGMQTSLSMVYDREMGSMQLLLTAPLPRWFILSARLSASVLVALPG